MVEFYSSDHRFPMPGRMAIYVYSHRQAGYVAWVGFDIGRQGCGRPAEACGAYSQRVYLL